MIFKKVLYPVFRKQFLKIYYLEQSKSRGFENMNKAFVDSNGRVYYCAGNDFDMPLERVREIERSVRKIAAGLSSDEYKSVRDAMKKALGEGKKPDIARIGHLITEMELREDMVLHPDLMFDLVAFKYIREDEDPAVIDKIIHKEKIEQFHKDSRDGLYDFFYKAGLSEYMPYLTKLEKDFQEYWERSTAKVKALKGHLEQYLSEAR